MKILPFTYGWIFIRHLGDIKKILDVGCGDGSFMQKIRSSDIMVDGVDLFGPYLKIAYQKRVYRKIINKDIRNMNFKRKSYEAVIASQVIEHLNKKDAIKVINNMEIISSKVVIIGTPNGHYFQEEYDGNRHQKHQSAWEVEDLKNLGYKIYGNGLKIVYGEGGLLYKKFSTNIFIKQLLYLFSYMCNPLTYIFPSIGAQLIAVKDTKSRGI